MKIFTFLLLAMCLPLLSRFQETRVFQNGRLVFEQATYSQLFVGSLMVAATIILLAMAWKVRGRGADGNRKPKLVHFTPALFALPAAWQNWQGSQFGDSTVNTEIIAGIGGPLTSVFMLAAAAFFIAIDAFWRQKENA